jgi:uncharacterized ParB-like nuclease family protein
MLHSRRVTLAFRLALAGLPVGWAAIRARGQPHGFALGQCHRLRHRPEQSL